MTVKELRDKLEELVNEGYGEYDLSGSIVLIYKINEE
jgi:hypothetical protein